MKFIDKFSQQVSERIKRLSETDEEKHQRRLGGKTELTQTKLAELDKELDDLSDQIESIQSSLSKDQPEWRAKRTRDDLKVLLIRFDKLFENRELLASDRATQEKAVAVLRELDHLRVGLSTDDHDEIIEWMNNRNDDLAERADLRREIENTDGKTPERNPEQEDNFVDNTLEKHFAPAKKAPATEHERGKTEEPAPEKENLRNPEPEAPLED